MESALFVIAPTDFRDEELFDTQEELERAGISSAVASTHTGLCRGRKGRNAIATLAVKDAHARDFSAVVFVGGGGVIEHKLHENPDVLRLAHEFEEGRKIVAAICVAPRILVRAGVINGRKATTYADTANIEGIKKQGIYTARAVEVDGRLITADGPLAAREFGKAVAVRILGKEIKKPY